ncbi:MAG: hypothetical protein RLZZ243_534, partial [Bacteroidota bacterium]
MHTHKASMDSLTKGLTIVVSVILILSGFVPIFTSEFQFSNVSTPASFYVMPFAFIIMLLLTYGFSPKGYSVQDGQLVIYRPFH